MNQNLKSTLWMDVFNGIRECHVKTLDSAASGDIRWRETFAILVQAIEEERVVKPDFGCEIPALTEETGTSYPFEDIFEEYFDFLEAKEDWIAVVSCCDCMVRLFNWKAKYPSEYMFRKGNALLNAGMIKEAEAFGREWLVNYPNDLYAAASNVFLLIFEKRYDEAKAITESCLSKELVCDNAFDTFTMAAYRLYEITDDANAKQRIEKKIAEFNALAGK